MTSYNPPLENLPIFDSSVFNNVEEPLTASSAGTQFLKYPVAQGTETFSDIIVLGTSNYSGTEIHNGTETHNGQIIANNVITQNNAILNINQTDHTNNNVGNVLRATQMYGDLQLLRPSGGNGGAMQFTDITNVVYGNNFTQQYQSGPGYAIINQSLGGNILLRQRNAATTSALINVLNLTTTGSTMQRSATDGNYEVLALKEQTIGNTISLYPHAPSNTFLYNIANDNLITSRNSNTNTPNTTALTIGCQSNQNNGIRIDSVNNTVEMGQGGTASGVYTNSFSCNGTNSTIKGPAVFSSTTAPTSAQSPALASNDSSNKIPTTAWVQTAIAANASGPLFFRANLNQQPTVSGTATLNINFNGSVANINDSFIIRYTIRYDFNTSSTGQSLYYMSYYGNMTVWPRRVITNNGSVSVLLNGSINGNTSYTYNDATKAPLGRYIWVENYSNTQVTNPLNFANDPVGLSFFDQTQMSFLFSVPYVAPASSSCSLGVSFELINTCSSTLTISAASIGFSNVNKNF